MTSTAAPTARRRSRGAVALLAIFAVVALGLGVTSADAAVTTPTLQSDPSSSTALKVSWPEVKGAASYQVQYASSSSFKSGLASLPATGTSAITGTSTTITGLTTNKTYYVRVVDVSSSGKVGTLSRAVAAAPRYPYAAPGDLFRTKVTRSSMTVSWKAVSGAPGYTVRAYSKGNPTKYFGTTKPSVNLTGLKASTTYYLSAYASKPGSQLSAYSPEVTTPTTSYAVATPDGLREAWQSSYSVGVGWTAVANLPAGGGYRISYALDFAQTDHDKSTATLRGTSATLTPLTVDTTYFAVIWAVDKSGKRASATSDFIVAKSRVPRGALSGSVDGVTGSDLTAAAYDSGGNVAQAVTVGADNKYTLSVRPGTYRVQLMYTGTGNYASAWAVANDTHGANVLGSASKVGVVQGKTTTVPKVTIRAGHTVTGTVIDPSNRPIRDVDVTAITVGSHEVISLTRSAVDGTFTLKGLSAGSYTLHFVYSGDGFKVYNTSPLTVSSNPGIKVRMVTAPFRAPYHAHILGKHKVGSTLTALAAPWGAGSYPTTNAAMSFQWRRNGAAIKGATGVHYKLGRADKGKIITLTATARRYGYTTGSVTSKGVRIS